MQDEKNKFRLNDMQRYIKIMVVSIAIGTIAVVGVFLIFALLFSKFNIPLSLVPIISTIAGVVGSFTASFIAGKILQKKGILVGLFCGSIICLFIFIAGLAFFELTIGFIVVTKFIAIIMGAIIGSVFGVNSKGK